MKSTNIFLTGVTGVLGAHLLKELLETTNSTIYCLVRSDSTNHARERTLAVLKAYDPKLKLELIFNSRVHFVVGDVTEHLFGLSESEYTDLSKRIDTTFHVAALTNLFVNYRRIAPINVGGTENVIKFVLKTAQKYLCYVSTHTVMGDKTFDKSVVFKENDLDVGQGFEYMNYQKSKFAAEQMVRKSMHQGLIWNIMRPGQIFGDSQTGLYPQGQTNVSGLFYDIFKTVIETKIALISQTHFDVVPVDYVSRGIVYLALRNRTYFETYHLTNPDVKRYSEVIGLLEDQGYTITFVPQKIYKDLLLSNKIRLGGQEYKSSTTSAFKWWFKKEVFDFQESAVTDCKYTSNILKKNNIKCAPLDSNLIGKYTDEAIRWNYFPKRPVKRIRSFEISAAKELEL